MTSDIDLISDFGGMADRALTLRVLNANIWRIILTSTVVTKDLCLVSCGTLKLCVQPSSHS